MAHSERTRPSRNGAAGAGQHAVSSRPPWPLRQDQPASPDQAELVLCEQTIFAMSSPIVLACSTDASFRWSVDTATLAPSTAWAETNNSPVASGACAILPKYPTH